MRAARLALLGGAAGLGAYWLKRYLRPERSTLVLNNSVVLITGASSGIGRALANAFARRGARLALSARRADLLEAVRTEVEPYAADVIVVGADLTRDGDIQRLVETVQTHFGQIDILVNNAGVAPDGLLQTVRLETIREITQVNLTAALILARSCLPGMQARGAGWILNVGSAAAELRAPFQPVSNASKAGLFAFSRSLNRQLCGTGVEVFTAMPAYAYTDMLRPAAERWARELGVTVDTPDYIAERCIAALLKGQHEVVFGGPPVQALLFLEQHFPALADLAWRALLTPNAIAAHERE